MYDYASYAWLTFTFFIAILLSIVLTRRSVFFSILTFLFALALLLIGPFLLKNILDDFLRPVNAKLVSYQKLHFSDVLVVEGELQNISKKDFTDCSADALLFKKSDNPLKDYIYKLKPFKKKTISLQKLIKVNESLEFQIVFYNYDSNFDINVSVKATCY